MSTALTRTALALAAGSLLALGANVAFAQSTTWRGHEQRGHSSQPDWQRRVQQQERQQEQQRRQREAQRRSDEAWQRSNEAWQREQEAALRRRAAEQRRSDAAWQRQQNAIIERQIRQQRNQRRWQRGQRYTGSWMPVNDYHRHGLRQPPRGAAWISDRGAYLLVSVGNHLILELNAP